ncbi:MAG: carbohydrate binding domain-containing protein [Terrimicrobiaceae bacterium]
MKKTHIFPILLFAGTSILTAAEPIPIKNPGFEKGFDAWTLDKGLESEGTVIKEAARTGEAGFRHADASPTEYVRLISQNVRVKAGKTYKLRFFANQHSGHSANVHFWFLDSFEEAIEPRFIKGPPEEQKPEWVEYEIVAKAPDNAEYAEIHIQSNRAGVGVVDFDDFVLEQVD